MNNVQSGWLVIDKPEGVTSAQAVARVKRFVKGLKVGHAGTLDPLACGVLPIALGEATKTIAFATDKTKTYLFTVKIGEERDTDDREGKVTAQSDVMPKEEAFRAVLPAFTGVIMQVPPSYSAIKVDGKRAYALARAGENVALKERPITIHTLTLEDYSSQEKTVTFRTTCGKGTYIRSLARDISRKLGAFGYVCHLKRERVGAFTLKHAIPLDQLGEIMHNHAPLNGLQPVASVLDDISALLVSPEEAKRLTQGQVIPLKTDLDIGAQAYAFLDGQVIALGCISETGFKPMRVLNYAST